MSLIVYSTSSVYGRQASSKHLNKRRYTCSTNIARYQLQLFIKFHNFRMHYLHILRLGGHHSISRRGGWSFCRGQIIYFNRARRCAENFAFYYMYRTVLEVKYFFHAKSARSYLFQKNSSPPPPAPGNWMMSFSSRLNCHAVIIVSLTHLKLYLATATYKWMKITCICSIWDQPFANFDVTTLISFPTTVI